MSEAFKKFQLVVLESPIENWSDPAVQKLFNKMVTLKKNGYESRYSQGVLPVDTSDFFATHVLLCEKKINNDLNPIMGYKTVSLSKCLQYNQNFPGLGLVQSANATEHISVVKDIVQRCSQNNTGLSYLGSWTIDPEFKNRCPQDVHLKSAFITFYHQLYQEQGIKEVLIGGTLRFKTEKLFAELGHRPLSKDGKDLSNIFVTHLVKEPVLVMHATQFLTPPTLQTKIWQQIWDERRVLGSSYAKLRLAA
ncbi:hypothetical protein AZI86_01820 [Bdellovibrio bacteriovorus]|uniref:Uncharacterized protein n=1 Tax=Bdellovibrio bacteriovorus TaxID=959 RepID=A0A150WN87_BDEBC|nr:hypothetical protein [Bdellovibrio bacteriovorus]KYG65836.1 hypothetical protein AZI86_01820 [Bdellovibrio bacteriovorus]